MNICLINPWLANKKQIDSDGFIPNNYSHIGLGYIKSTLEQEGHKVILLDMRLQQLDKEGIEKIICENSICVVGITSYSYNLIETISLCRFIRKRFPEIFIVAGGFHPTLATNDAASMINADCYVIGEGEETMKELVSAIENNNDWHCINGVAYLNESRKVVISEPRELISNLDLLPFPYRMPGLKTAVVIPSRGCYGQCKFCSSNAFFKTCTGKKVRRRSPENVVEEIITIVKEHDVEYINFYDDNFAISSKKDREWFDKFHSLLIKNKLNTKICALMRPNEVINSEDVINKFIQVGLRRVFLGIESFNQNQLDFYDKNLTVDQAINAIKTMSNMNVDLYVSLVLFDPRITIDEMIDNANKLKSVCQFFSEHFIMKPLNWVLIAYEGTGARDYVVDNGLYTITNEIYYNFLYNDIQELYNSRVKWFQEVKMFSGWSDWFYAKDNCSESIKQRLFDFYAKLFLLDVDTLLYSCDMAKKGMQGSDIFKNTLDKYGDHLNHLKCLYEKLDAELSGCLTYANSTKWLQSQDYHN